MISTLQSGAHRVARAAVAAVFMATLASCSSDEAGATTDPPPVEPADSSPTPTAEPEPEFKVANPVISTGAADRYPDAVGAVDMVVAVVTEYCYGTDLMRTAPAKGLDRALTLLDVMTPVGANAWERTARAYARKGGSWGSDAFLDAGLLTMWGWWHGREPRGYQIEIAADRPVLARPKITRTEATLAIDGRLAIAVDSRADLGFRSKGRKYFTTLTREQTFWLKHTRKGWRIDGWDSSYETSDAEPAKRRG